MTQTESLTPKQRSDRKRYLRLKAERDALKPPDVITTLTPDFASDRPAMPLAVLGLRNAENVFVGEDGSWQPGCYIPAYIRRVPFIFLESADKLNFTLCIDEASEFLVEEDDAQPLFADGKPSEVTDNALKFCSASADRALLERALAAPV